MAPPTRPPLGCGAAPGRSTISSASSPIRPALRAAPHIIWPPCFALPYHNGLRAPLLIRTGLFLYDNIGGRKILPGTRRLDCKLGLHVGAENAARLADWIAHASQRALPAVPVAASRTA